MIKMKNVHLEPSRNVENNRVYGRGLAVWGGKDEVEKAGPVAGYGPNVFARQRNKKNSGWSVSWARKPARIR